MATTTNDQPAGSAASFSLDDPNLRPLWYALGALGLAFSFGGVQYFGDVLSTDHFSHAALVPLASAFLIWYRPPSLEGLKPGSAKVAMVGFALCALMLFDSLLAGTSTNWVLAVVLAVVTSVYLIGGTLLVARCWPALVLLLLMVRPPFSLDLRLATGLQLWVSAQASSILDMLNVSHYLEGNIIHLVNQPLHVEEACSGINSLFATGAVLVFAMLLLRRPVAHAIALFGFGFIAVLAVNVFRVVALTWMHHYSVRLGEFFDMTIPHMAFGMGCFAILLLLLFSGDALLFLSIDRLWYVLPAGLMMRLRWLTGGDPEEAVDPDAEPPPDTKPKAAEKVETEPLDQTIQARAGTWRFVTLGFGAMAALQIVVVGLAMSRGDEVAELPEGDPLAGKISANLLPSEWNGWKLSSFNEQENMDFVEANYSSQWRFERDDQVAYVYLHRPYVDFHQLQACYSGTGWTVTDKDSGIIEDPGLQFVMYNIERDGDGLNALAFSYADLANQNWLVPPVNMQSTGLAQRVRNSLNFRAKAMRGLFDRKTQEHVAAAGLVVQVQTSREQTDESRALAKEMLVWAAHQMFPEYASTVR